jgi:DNA-directed RNA polymerase specialized sigma24 family protein
MKPTLYDKDNPIKWRELTFDELLRLIEGRVNYHVNRQKNTLYKLSKYSLPDLEADDIKQELTIALWRKLDRIPSDIIVFDFRFLRYIDTIFARTVIDLFRNRTFVDKETGARLMRDELNRAAELTDEMLESI